MKEGLGDTAEKLTCNEHSDSRPFTVSLPLYLYARFPSQVLMDPEIPYAELPVVEACRNHNKGG